MSDTKQLVSQFYLDLDGAPVPEELYRDLLEITVESSLHLPDVATVIIHDPKLKWVDDPKLLPGKTLVVKAKAGQSEEKIFDGEIVELEPEFQVESQRLVVRAFDRLHRLARGRQVRSFLNVTDGDLVSKLAKEAGLQFQADATTQVHPYVLQENETNLNFLQRRAAMLGYLLYVEGQKLCFKKPAENGAPLELQWGQTLAEFRPRMSTISQLNGVTARGWDPQQKRAIVGQSTDTAAKAHPAIGHGESGGETAKKAFKLEAKYLVADRILRTQSEADKIALSYAGRFGGKFVEAEGTAAGNPKIVAGASVKISAVGERFSGNYFVTGASHTYNMDSGYQTRFTISGLQPATLLDTLLPEREPARIDSLVIGIVTDNQDPEDMGRVKVKFPWLTDEHASNWARVVSAGAGPDRGIEFLPEVNDEVLVGFEHGDINFPYVIGGLWNGKDVPPFKNSDAVKGGKVIKRTIRSRIGHEVTLSDDDGQKEILIKTPGGNQIRISDTDKIIEIKSSNSTVKLDDQGRAVSLDTSGDLKISSQGRVSIEAATGLELKSNATVSIQGTGPTELKSTAILTLQGSLVKIN